MKIAIISLFPETFQAMHYGITGRALKKGLIKMQVFNPRDYTTDIHRTVDDRPYGGGPGMVMLYEPLKKAINAAKHWTEERTKVIYLSPQGKRLVQKDMMAATQLESLILLAGRYEGIDQRIIDHYIDEEWSIGDYVLSGGELPAMVVVDAMTRLLPNALNDPLSAIQDSFAQGLLDYPHYTRPQRIDGYDVPKVLLGGNHEEIATWRHQQALQKTLETHPKLLECAQHNLTEEQP